MLIEIGYGFEQITKARIRPRFLAHASVMAQLQGGVPPALATDAVQSICPDNPGGDVLHRRGEVPQLYPPNASDSLARRRERRYERQESNSILLISQ